MKTATIYQTKTHLSRLLREMQQGEEIVVLQGKTPVARLVPYQSRKSSVDKRPKVGTVTSPGCRSAKDAFAPLGDRELEEWGI